MVSDKKHSEVVQGFIEKEYNKYVGNGETLQAYHLWDKEDIYRYRVNIRNRESWFVTKSFYVRLKLNGQDVSVME